MPECFTCGSSKFYTNDGFYFCSRCQTQLEGDQEEVFDFGIVTQGKKIDVRKKEISNTGGSTEVLTSWEIFNQTLKYLVDKMINLGANKNLKIVVLQLWATYLSRVEIAFASSKSFLKVDLTTKKRDLEILSGRKIKKLKTSKSLSFFTAKNNYLKRIKKRRKDVAKSFEYLDETDPDMNQSKKRQLTRFKRKIAAAEYSQSQDLMQESSQLLSQTQTLDDIGDSTSEKASSRLIMNAESKVLWRAMRTMMKGKSHSEKREIILKAIRRHNRTSQSLSILSIWAFLQLGMILSGQEATISDLLRWNLEGHISHSEMKELLPTDVQGEYLNRLLHDRRLTRASLRENIIKMANFLSVSEFPFIDLNRLSSRYVQELNLPDEIKEKLDILFILCKPEKYFSGKTVALDCDLIAMAYIIISLKLFFGLDGKTESLSSKLSNYLNRLTDHNGKKFFSWTDWTRYIECRKCILADLHYPTRITHSTFSFSKTGNNAFYNYINEKKITFSCRKSKTTELDKQITEAIEGLGTSFSSYPQFPPTLFPLSTYLNLVVREKSDILSSEVIHLLSEQFTDHNLILPDMYPDLCKTYEVVLNNIGSNLRPRTFRDFEPFFSKAIPFSFGNVNVEAVIVEGKKKDFEKIESGKEFATKLSHQPSSPKASISKKRKRKSTSSNDGIDVSKIAKNLLKKRLSELTHHKDFAHPNSRCDLNCGLSSKSESFLVNNPYEHYWVLHLKDPISKEDFDNISKRFFTVSFYWLLQECSNMINACPKDLYTYIMKIEKNLHSFFCSVKNK